MNYVCCRCLVQLAVLGVALALVLHEHLWWLALLFGVGMAAVAAAEAVSRPSASYEVRPNQATISCAAIMSHGSTCGIKVHNACQNQLRCVARPL